MYQSVQAILKASPACQQPVGLPAHAVPSLDTAQPSVILHEPAGHVERGKQLDVVIFGPAHACVAWQGCALHDATSPPLMFTSRPHHGLVEGAGRDCTACTACQQPAPMELSLLSLSDEVAECRRLRLCFDC